MTTPIDKAKQGKRKAEAPAKEDSESESESVPSSPVPLTGLAVPKRRKTELEKLGEMSFSAPTGESASGVDDPTPSRGRRAAATKSGLVTKSRGERRGGLRKLAEAPAYRPKKDKNGSKIWGGQRGSLGWFANVQSAMDSVKAGCTINGTGCTGTADAIDHVEDFATAQTTIPERDLCDGRHHWKAVLLKDAKFVYNGRHKSTEKFGGKMAQLQRQFRWSCTHCNSSRGGQQGNDVGAPKWIEACPGRTACTL
ncbi:MAG TPA: hypothetical protein VMB79_14645 [Jatrophihabitans sp.]|nr:hypothetical protein [Jatrophihabitans sp.]